jgi:hypothetical protein
LKGEIENLIAVRKRNDVNATSKVEIMTAESDLYVAKIDDKVILKIGPRFDMGHLAPNAEYQICAVGKKISSSYRWLKQRLWLLSLAVMIVSRYRSLTVVS